MNEIEAKYIQKLNAEIEKQKQLISELVAGLNRIKGFKVVKPWIVEREVEELLTRTKSLP